MFCIQKKRVTKKENKKKGGTWSSLVYGTRFEHEHFNKVVGSNPAVPVNLKVIIFIYK